MDLPASSSSSNFSAVARRLLLSRHTRESQALTVPYIPQSEPECKPKAEQHATVLLPHNVDNNKVPTNNPEFDFMAEEVFDVEPEDDDMSDDSSEQLDYDSSGSDLLDSPIQCSPTFESKMMAEESAVHLLRTDPESKPPAEQPILASLREEFPDVKRPRYEIGGLESTAGSSGRCCLKQNLCTRLQRFSVETLKALNSDEANRPKLGSKSKVLIRRARQFFEEIKKILGDSCKGTIFYQTVELTAWACGVTTDTVTRIGKKAEFLHEQLPLAKIRYDKNHTIRVALKRHGGRWGPIIRDFIENRLPKDHMTVPLLHDELCRTYPDFLISTSTLKYVLYGLGVKFVRKRRKQIMVFDK